ncbi:hypothetical protein ACHAQJ_007546 [Trichoderma viride]
MSVESDLEVNLSDTLIFLDTSIILRSMLDMRDIVGFHVSSTLYSENGGKRNDRSATRLPVEEIHDNISAPQTFDPELGSQQQLTRGFLIEGGQGNAGMGNNIIKKRSQTLVRTKRAANGSQSKNTAPEDESAWLKTTMADLLKQLKKMQKEQQKDRQKTEQDMMALKRELDNKTELIRKCEADVVKLNLKVMQSQESRTGKQLYSWYSAVDDAPLIANESTAMVRMTTRQSQHHNTPRLLLKTSARKKKNQRKRRDASKLAQQLAMPERVAARPIDSSSDVMPLDKEDTFTLDCILDRRLKMFFYVRWAVDLSESWVRRKDIFDKQMIRDFEDSYQGLNEGIEIVQKKKDAKGKLRYQVHWKNGNSNWPEWVVEDALSPQCLESIGI